MAAKIKVKVKVKSENEINVKVFLSKFIFKIVDKNNFQKKDKIIFRKELVPLHLKAMLFESCLKYRHLTRI